MMLAVIRAVRTGLTFKHLRILLLAGATTSAIALYALSRPMVDFSVYWTAAHLFVSHQNPYEFSNVLQFQRGIGWDGVGPIILLCPPWTLSFIAPLGWADSYV